MGLLDICILILRDHEQWRISGVYLDIQARFLDLFWWEKPPLIAETQNTDHLEGTIPILS